MSNEVATITPSALQPAAKPAAPAPVAPSKSPELVAAETRLAEYETKLAAADKKLRVNGIEVMKVATEKKQLGAKLAAHDRMEKALKAAGLSPEDLEQFKVNPRRTLEKGLGEKWYDRIVEERINGGAPTAEVLAAELSRTKEEIRAELKAEAEAQKAEQSKAAEERTARAREELATEAAAFLEKSWGDYPIFEGVAKPNVARAIAQYVENEFHRTGKILSPKEAADGIESAEISRAEKLAGIEKYRTRLTEKLKPATLPLASSKSEGQDSRRTEVERRTLSNDLTATTPTAKRAHRTDEERLAAIKALNLDR